MVMNDSACNVLKYFCALYAVAIFWQCYALYSMIHMLFSWFSTTTSASVFHFLLYICGFSLCFTMFCIYFWNVLEMFEAGHEWVRHRIFSYHICHLLLVIYYHCYSLLIFILLILIGHPLIFIPPVLIFLFVLFAMFLILWQLPFIDDLHRLNTINPINNHQNPNQIIVNIDSFPLIIIHLYSPLIILQTLIIKILPWWCSSLC